MDLPLACYRRAQVKHPTAEEKLRMRGQNPREVLTLLRIVK